MSLRIKVSRPEFRNVSKTKDLLWKYKWKPAALVSLVHRGSGMVLFLLSPLILYFFDQSLTSEASFRHLQDLLSNWFVKLIFLVICWGYLQHFCSGIRHLVMDLHIGLDKESARGSAIRLFVVTGVLTVLIALKLFGAF
ncbi:MAG: succinate dehydrogenase, cytochrome b556 subunit [Burkholderiaceae bacterium]|nr:succinate dehydrogenase, cytochrome b556 subunit [Burkholderiaceae bacterium]